jgi:hypothetical protein
MAKEKLNAANVCPRPDEVNGKRMSKRVRVDIEAYHLSILLDNGVDLPSFDGEDRLILLHVLAAARTWSTCSFSK